MERASRVLFAALASALVLVGCTSTDEDEEFGPGEYSWGLPERLDEEGGVAEPALAVGPSGAAVAVWVQWEGGVWANEYMPDDGWGTARRIEGTAGMYTLEPDVAIDRDGRAMAVWKMGGAAPRVMASRFTPESGWDTATPIESTAAPDDVHEPSVAVDGDGNAVAVWRRSGASPAVAAAHYDEATGWGDPTRIDTDQPGVPREARGVALDPNGNAIAIWIREEQEESAVLANRYTPNEGWAAPQAIGDPTPTRIHGAELAVDGAGNAIAVWDQNRELAGDQGSVIMANRYTPTGGWEGALRLDDQAHFAVEPRVAMNDAGTAFTVWVRAGRDDDELSGVWSRRFAPSSGWESDPVPVLQASARVVVEGQPQVAVDPRGAALAVWHGYEQYEGHIWSSHYDSDTGWDDAVVLSYRRISDRKGLHEVGIDDEGRGTAVWFQAGPGDYLAMANHYDDAAVTEDPTPTWETICDAACADAEVCAADPVECESTCMEALGRRPCDPNAEQLDACVEALEEWPCEEVESGFLPPSCAYACAGDAGDAGYVGPGVCQVPLAAYCEGSSCPTWDDAVTAAEEAGRETTDYCGVVGGECGDLRYIGRYSLWGYEEFFDASGALVARRVYNDVPGYCYDTAFDKWYGEPPNCEQEPSHNYCKGYGPEYCASVEACGMITEAECLARYDDPTCWARWDSYVYCFSRDGTCESCADRLPEWEMCVAPEAKAR